MHADINEDKSNYYNQNTFTVLEFSNITTFSPNYVLKSFEKVKISKTPDYLNI